MPAPLDVTLPSPLEIRISRHFDAPPSLVWDAHFTPALVQRWMLGPPGWTMPVCEMDLRVGGAFRYRWRSEDGATEFGTEGEILEVDPPHRLVHSERMDGFDGVAIETTEFVADGDGTAYSTTIRYPTEAARDAALASGMTEGMSAGYDRLEAVVAEQTADHQL